MTQPATDGRAAEVAQTLGLFCSGQLTELRAFGHERNSLCAVVYRDFGEMARRALQLDADPGTSGVYFVPNAIRPDFVPAGRPFKAGSAGAADIARRRWLLIDLDPARVGPGGDALSGAAANVPSSEAERAAAWAVADAIRHLLHGLGMCGLVLADSGNGWHLCYPIDLPADQESYDLVSFVLAELEARCGNAACHIDQKTKDAPRIWKLYGTVARKGRESADRPWRVSQLVEWEAPTDETREVNNKALQGIAAVWRLQRETVERLAQRPHAAPPAGRADAVARARAYAAKEEPSVSGQGGHDRAFHVACVLLQGFDLTEEEALAALQDWNARCDPPWSEKELRHKIAGAAKAPCDKGKGYLLREERQREAQARQHRPGPPPVVFDPLPGEEVRAAGKKKDRAERTVVEVCTVGDLKESGASVAWLWEGWVQANVLTAMAAEGGTGKTRWCADLVRRIRHSLPWPDGQPMTLPPTSPVLWVVSDNHHDEMVSLCESFGIADSVFVNAWKDDPYDGTTLDTPDDYRDLDRRVQLVKPALVIVDTVGNATDKSLSRQEDAKAFYAPLQVIARRHRCAVLCLTHLNASGRFLGRRVLEKVRVALKMEQPSPDDPRRRLEVIKSNSKRPAPLGVTMGDRGNEYDANPPEPAEQDEPGRPRGGNKGGAKAASGPRLEQAKEWLRDWLSVGPRPVGNTRTEAEKAGISAGTLYDAMRALGVDENTTQGRKWWVLAENEQDI